MRIDPKYFSTFLLIIALVGAGLIALFTLKNRSNEKEAFKKRMFAQDSLQSMYWPKVQGDDSLRISDFRGDFLVVDFWANWSGASEKSHQQLAVLKKEFPDTLEVIAASVGLSKKEVVSYIKKHNFPFLFVAGSKYFSTFNIPGLPAQLIYNPKGELEHVFLGYKNASRYDSLRALISNEKN